MYFENRKTNHVDVEALINPRTAEEWLIAINTPETPAYKFIQDIIAANIQFEIALEKFFERYREYSLQEDKARADALHKKRIIEEKREEKERQRVAIEELKATMEKEVEKIPGKDLDAKAQYAAATAYQIDVLRTENDRLKTRVKKIENEMADIDLEINKRRGKKLNEFRNDLHSMVIRNAQDEEVKLSHAQITQLVNAAFVSPSKISKYNPELVREHQRLEKEQEGTNLKDINEIQWNKLGVIGQLNALSLLNQFLNGKMNFSTLNTIVQNNREIGNKLSRFYKTISDEDKKAMHDLFALSGKRFATKDQQDLNNKKIKVYEDLLQQLAADVNKEYKKKK